MASYTGNPDRLARRLGELVSTHAPAEVIEEARRYLAEAKLDEYITKVVDKAGPSRPAARRLALLLNGTPQNQQDTVE